MLQWEFDCEYYDNKDCKFHKVERNQYTFVHSLRSVRIYEDVTKESFSDLNRKKLITYARCMLTDVETASDFAKTKAVLPNTAMSSNVAFLIAITDEIKQDYNIDKQEVLTPSGRRNKESLSSNDIYAMMIVLHIPTAYECWHLSRLIALVHKVSEIKYPDNKAKKRKQYEDNKRTGDKLIEVAIMNQKAQERWNALHSKEGEVDG